MFCANAAKWATKSHLTRGVKMHRVFSGLVLVVVLFVITVLCTGIYYLQQHQESLTELEAALAARADRVMLDNFSMQHISDAVKLADGRVELEVSGNVTADSLLAIANTGVDYISIGALTKDVTAMDLSMRLEHTS